MKMGFKKLNKFATKYEFNFVQSKFGDLFRHF